MAKKHNDADMVENNAISTLAKRCFVIFQKRATLFSIRISLCKFTFNKEPEYRDKRENVMRRLKLFNTTSLSSIVPEASD